MRIIFTLTASLILSANIWACSYHPEPFCKSVDSNRTLIYGKIIDTVPHGMRVNVLKVFKGVETRDTITVWNTSYWCMDSVEIGLNEYGFGDTVFFVLPLVDSSIHGWDVVGDYRMQLFDDEYLALYVNGGIVRGFISGYPTAPYEFQTYAYELEAFKTWLETQGTCNTIVSITEPSALDLLTIYPNPATDYIAINNLPLNAILEVLSIDGQHVSDVSLNDNRISTAHLAAGSYLLKISYQSETGFRRIVKL